MIYWYVKPTESSCRAGEDIVKGCYSVSTEEERVEMIEKIGCPNPFVVELTPEIIELGERLSEEISDIQNGLQPPYHLSSPAQ